MCDQQGSWKEKDAVNHVTLQTGYDTTQSQSKSKILKMEGLFRDLAFLQNTLKFENKYVLQNLLFQYVFVYHEGEIMANYLQKGMDRYEIPQYSSLSIGFWSLKDVCLHSNVAGSYY